MPSIRNTTASSSLRAPASYNQRRSSTARNNSGVPYPYYQDVYVRSVDPAGDNGFPDLDLQDFLVATRRVGRRHMARLRMTDHNSELLSRGLQARMDDREDRNPVVEACLGYAGAVGVMAMDAMASDGERTDEAMQGIVESVRRVDARQDEWAELMGTQSGRVDALAAELVDARAVMEELRRDLEAERRAREAMQELLATSQLEAHMARNGISCLRRQLRRAGVNIPRDADWPSADIPAPSEAPSPSSTRISAPGTGSIDDPLEIVPDSEDEEVVQIPAPRLSTWSGPGRLVPILDQTIVDFMAREETQRRRLDEEFVAGTLQAEETARRDPVPEYGGDDEVPPYRDSPEL